MNVLARFGLTAAARAAIAIAIALLTYSALATVSAERASAAMTVTVDAPAEDTVFTDSGDIPAIEFTVIGDYASVLCNFDDDAPADCFSMQFVAPFKLAGGAHTATVLAIDDAGSAATAIANFSVDDTTAPVLSIDSPAEDATVTDLLQFDLTIDDASADLYARIDNGPLEQVDVFDTSVTWLPTALINGAHTVAFTAIDPAGNQTAQTRNFTLADVTAPVLSNISPAPGSTVLGDRVRVSFDSDDPNVRSGFSLDGHAGLDLSPGTWIDIPDVAPGSHTLAVAATDNAGNSTTEASTFTASVASTGPLTIISPADGATYAARPLLQIADPALGEIDYARCKQGGGAWFDCANQNPIAGISNGTVTIDVRAVTLAGDLLTASATFTVDDTAPPGLTVSYPAPGEVVNQLTGFAPVLDIVNRFADDTDDPDVRVRCRLDGDPFGNCGALVGEAENLAASAHTLKVEAIDWAGNAVVQVVSFSVADISAPEVNILSPADGATVSSGRPAVTFWSDDWTARFRCRIDGGPTTEYCHPDYAWLPGAESGTTLESGAHSLSVTATDQAGNASTVSVDVTLADDVDPVVTIVSPAAAATLDGRVTVRWTANERVARVRCRIDGGPQISDIAQCASNDQGYERSGVFVPSALANGARTLAIDAYDAAGNLGTASVAVTVADTTAPVVYINGFAYAGGITHADAPIGVYFSSDDPAAAFECRLDGGSYVTCGNGNSREWNFPPPDDGSHTVDVRATDAAGLSTVASATFTVADTTPPTVSVRHLGEELGDSSLVPISFTAEIVALGAVTIDCYIDGGPPMNCTSGSVLVSFGSGGVHTLQAAGIDAAGNETLVTLSLIVDPDTVPAPPIPDPVPPGPDPVPPGPVPTPADSAPPAAPAPPAVPPAPRAAFAAVKTRIARGNVTLTVKVFVTLPAGVDATAACKGSAPLTVKVRRKTVGKAKAGLRLSRGVCSAVATLKLKAKRVAGKKANFTMEFAGNNAVGGFTARKTVKIKRAKKK